MTPTAKDSLTAIVLFLCGTAFAADPPPAWEAKGETAVGGAKVFTRAVVSCQKASQKLAVELINGTAPGAQNAFKPNKDPRIVCSRPNGTQDLKADWEVGETGAPVARDLQAAALRQCSKVAMVQEVALPQGWSAKSARLELQIDPTVFAGCEGAEAAWQTARVIPGGKTNVRGEPNTNGKVVATLEPGTAVLVQKTGNEWWRAKAEKAPGFEGYIRNDRLAFK